MNIIDTLTSWLNLALEMVSPFLITFWSFFNDYAYFRVSLIATASYLLAKYLSSLTAQLIKNISQRLHFKLGTELSLLLEAPLFYFIFLNGLILVVVFSKFSEATHFVTLALLKSLLIIVLSASLLRIVKLFLQKAADNAEANKLVQPQTLPLFKNAALIFILTGAIHQIFSVWGVDMTALLASAGIAGLAIGMASKDMISDVISGIMIITDAPYKLKDTIELESGVRGKVTHIGIRSTRMVTKDNLEIIIPNSTMSNTQVINESSSEEEGVRLKLVISTAAKIDSEHIRTLVFSVIDNNNDIFRKQEKQLQMLDFNERCITFRLLFWIKDPFASGKIMTQVREAIYKQFLHKNIPLALPTENEVAIVSQPALRQEIAITEIPSLFGNGKPRPIGKVVKSTSTQQHSKDNKGKGSSDGNNLEHTTH